MRRRAGQALRWTRRVVHLVVPAALLVGLIAAYRLGQGPLPVPMIARQIERAVNAEGGLRLAIGHAAIAWEGFRSGSAAPLDIRLEDVTLRDATGALRADLPAAAVTLSMRALLQGRLAPASVELRGPSILVSREADGAISLGAGLGGAGGPPEPAGPGAGRGAAAEPAEATPLAGLLAALHRTSREGRLPALASFRRLRILDGQVLVQDRVLDRRWALDNTGIDIRRGGQGSLSVEGSATVQSIGMAVPIRLTANMPASDPARLTAELALPALRPTELASLWPELAPLRLLDAPITLGATATISAEGDPPQARARLVGGPGALDFGDGRRIPFTSLGATVEGEAGLLRLSAATLHLAGEGAPTLHASGEARRDADGWTAGLSVSMARLGLSALPRLWPAGLAGPARAPVLAALTGGAVEDLKLDITLAANSDFGVPRLREARAAFAMDHATVAIGAAAAEAGIAGPAPDAKLVAERLDLAARLTPDSLQVERLDLRLAPPTPAAPATSLALTAAAARDPASGAWAGTASLGLDTLRFADLPALWPAGLRNSEREWITHNVTAGTLRDGHWRVEGSLAPGAAAPVVTALSGTASVSDATVHWLRPVPPIQGIAGTASFSLSEIAIRAQGGRQLGVASPGTRAGRASAQSARTGAGVDAKEAVIRFLDLEQTPSRAEIEVQLHGALPEVLALLRHPRLHLFDRKPLEIGALAGQAEARVHVGFPLLSDLPMELLRLRAAGRVTDARLTEVLMGHELERGAFDFAVDTDGLKLNGTGVMVDAPLRASVEMDFRPGPASQVTDRAQLSVPRADARQLESFGLDTGGLMQGTAAVEARYERRRNGQASVALRGDLRETRLAFAPVGWSKPAGVPGSAETTLRLAGDQLQAAEELRVDTAGLLATGRIVFAPGNRMERVEIAPGSRLGGTQFGGAISRPARPGGPWAVVLRGPVADLQPILAGPDTAEPGRAERAPRVDASTPAGPSFALDLQFDRGTTGEGRNLLGLAFRADVDGHGLLRSAQGRGRTGPNGAFDLTLALRGAERHLSLTAADGGALLQALDLSDAISGGRLTVTGSYRELRPGAPLAGVAELDGFAVRNAPGLGKLLQAMTLYGVLEAMQGGNGLVFTRLVAPFTLTPETLGLHDARAFSASLGLTAKGSFHRRQRVIDMEGTVVPAYFFNQLLGNIPVLGRLFSPERGGGVFAATYRVRGPSADPTVSVNPLAALTPGFLRGVFGLAEGGRGAPVPNPTDR